MRFAGLEAKRLGKLEAWAQGDMEAGVSKFDVFHLFPSEFGMAPTRSSKPNFANCCMHVITQGELIKLSRQI